MKPEVRERFHEAGRIAAKAREHGKELIEPGRRLAEIVESCDALIRDEGGEPAFPSQISVNHIAAHYCPPPGDPTSVGPSDICKLDVGVQIEGFVADNAVTVDLRDGEQSPLSLASKLALENVIAIAGPGVALREIGRTIHDTITAMGFKPIFNLTGHGVARWTVHCAPQVPNYDDGRSGILKAGQTVAIEPFATDGSGYIDERGKAEVFQQGRSLRPKDKLPGEIHAMLEAFHGLPFARRDVERHMSGAAGEKALAFLARKRLLHEYPPLAERPGVRISQHEHTLLITDSGVEVTTRPDG